jgi:hypothetical protein
MVCPPFAIRQPEPRWRPEVPHEFHEVLIRSVHGEHRVCPGGSTDFLDPMRQGKGAASCRADCMRLLVDEWGWGGGAILAGLPCGLGVFPGIRRCMGSSELFSDDPSEAEQQQRHGSVPGGCQQGA